LNPKRARTTSVHGIRTLIHRQQTLVHTSIRSYFDSRLGGEGSLWSAGFLGRVLAAVASAAPSPCFRPHLFETGSPLGQHPAGWPVVHPGAAHALATRCRQQAGQLASIGGWRPRVWRLEQPIVGLRVSMCVVWNITVRACINNPYVVRTLVMY
jgi:hypothetical protein